MDIYTRSEIFATFRASARANGYELPDELISDTIEFQRFNLPGRKGKAAYYKVWTDGIPYAIYGDWSTSEKLFWSMKGNELTPQQRAQARKETESNKLKRDKRIATQARRAAVKYEKIWDQLEAPPADHPYLVRKKITRTNGIRYSRRQKCLVIPMRSADGNIQSLQRIFPDGSKKFAEGGSPVAAYCGIGKAPASTDTPVVICEGWATGIALFEMLGATVVVAFSDHNLPAIARIMKGKYPYNPIIVAGDNDYKPDKAGNAGVEWAIRAAKAASCEVAICDLVDGEKADWWDWWARRGTDVAVAHFNKMRRSVEPIGEGPADTEPQSPEGVWEAEVQARGHFTGGGSLKGDLWNTALALRHHPALHNAFGWDVMADLPMVMGPREWLRPGRYPRPLEDADYTRATLRIQQIPIPTTIRLVQDCLVDVCRDNPFNPLTQVLDTLQWDGTQRVDTWLTDFFGADENAYTRAVGRAWLISAVARAFKPGCKADHVLVLEGDQGLQKSTALQALAMRPEWFDDTVENLAQAREAAMRLPGKWIVELQELEALKKAESTAIKQFLTLQADHYRRPYERHPVKVPRRNVFVGTTNESGGYLRDHANRRFWPVWCRKADAKLIADNAPQLWAEAVELYKAGKPWWLTNTQEMAALSEQALRVNTDPWQAPIEEYINVSCEGGLEMIGSFELLKYALGEKVSARLTPTHAARIGTILRGMHWRRSPSKWPFPGCPGYRQYYYVSPNTIEERGADWYQAENLRLYRRSEYWTRATFNGAGDYR